MYTEDIPGTSLWSKIKTWIYPYSTYTEEPQRPQMVKPSRQGKLVWRLKARDRGQQRSSKAFHQKWWRRFSLCSGFCRTGRGELRREGNKQELGTTNFSKRNMRPETEDDTLTPFLDSFIMNVLEIS